MVKRKLAFRRKRQNRLGMVLVTIAVLMLLLVVGVKSIELKQKQQAYAAREAQLREEIEDQQVRSQEIEEFEKYTKTKKYAEEVAKDKLGLVHSGEILFREKQ